MPESGWVLPGPTAITEPVVDLILAFFVRIMPPVVSSGESSTRIRRKLLEGSMGEAMGRPSRVRVSLVLWRVKLGRGV